MNLDKIDAITPTEYTRYRYIDSFLVAIGSSIRKACDVGCGVGNLLVALEDHHIESKGIDTSEESLAIGRTRIESPHIKIEKMSVFDLKERFDLVYLTEVLEHIPDDLGLLRFLRDNVIGENGYFIITVPAHRLLYSPFDKNAGHIRRYDKRSLISLIENGGFKPILCWSYGSLLSHIAANLSLLFGRSRSNTGKSGIGCDERTRISAIRHFGAMARPFVSRVNIIHRALYMLDYSLRKLDLGIGYCLLCKVR
jgi:SAM-dependent methyltransferase